MNQPKKFLAVILTILLILPAIPVFAGPAVLENVETAPVAAATAQDEKKAESKKDEKRNITCLEQYKQSRKQDHAATTGSQGSHGDALLVRAILESITGSASVIRVASKSSDILSAITQTLNDIDMHAIYNEKLDLANWEEIQDLMRMDVFQDLTLNDDESITLSFKSHDPSDVPDWGFETLSNRPQTSTSESDIPAGASNLEVRVINDHRQYSWDEFHWQLFIQTDGLAAMEKNKPLKELDGNNVAAAAGITILAGGWILSTGDKKEKNEE